MNREPVRFGLEILNIYFSKHVSRSAAELAYFLIMSFFPVLICVNAFIGRLNLDAASVLSSLSGILPREAVSILVDYLEYISNNQSTALLVAGVVMTLLTASAAFRALMNIMGDIYERKSYKGLRKLGLSLLCSILFLVTIYLSIVVLLTGGWLLNMGRQLLQLNISLHPVWKWLRYLILFLLVFLFVLLVYRMSAPGGRPKPPVFLGAVIATAALVIASVIFSFFISLSTRFSLVYGSLTSIIILLVWLYLCGTILIMGNAFNCVWNRRQQMVNLQEMYRQCEAPEAPDKS